MKEAISKASVLIEAMPYIQEFRDKIVVIKFGGSAMLDEGTMRNVLRDIVLMELVGMQPVLIHGGGSAISEEMKKKGKKPVFAHGLRVTDGETIKIVQKTLFEVVNKKLVKIIAEFGGIAEPLSGEKDKIIEAKKKKVFDPGNPEKEIDMGFAGDVEKAHVARLKNICSDGKIPVIAPLGYNKKDETFNVNADHAAAEIAAALKAEKMVFLTNVRGVIGKREDKEDYLIPSITVKEIEKLKQKKVITGGMLPKVESCVHAVKSGVHKTHIIDAKIQHSLLLEIFTDKGIGTEILV